MIVTISEGALVRLHNLPVKIRARIEQIFERLKSWPQVSGAKALKGNLSGQYRIRTGDYRIQFLVGKSEIIIVQVGHREGFYEENMPRKINFKSLASRYDAVSLSKWSIGYTIRESREKIGMTVRALAAAVGVSVHRIERLECGKSEIDIRLIDRISKIVGAA